MLMEKAMVELVPRSYRREPCSGRTSSQEHQLVAVGVVISDGYGLLVLVDIIKRCELWIHVGRQGIFVKKRSTFLLQQTLRLKLPGIRWASVLR